MFSATSGRGEVTVAPAVDGLPGSFGPKELVAAGLAGCTGMDVASILEKMRQVPERLVVTCNAESAEEHPKYLTRMHLIYDVGGAVDPGKLRHAVELSLARYCGVAETLSGRSQLTYEIRLNGDEVARGTREELVRAAAAAR